MMLLVALDIEGCASEVLGVAGQLAVELGSALTLLYVAPSSPSVPDGLVLPGHHETVHEWVEHEATAALRSLAAPWLERGVSVDFVVEFGSPEDQVLAVVQRTSPRMLVLGTHARTGLARWVFGSVEEAITRRSPVPVLVVPGTGTVDHRTPAHQALLNEENG